MSTHPKISVVMPVYNAGHYVRGAVESILRQTFSDFEFFILDDGSTDDTPEIVNRISDERITVVRGRHEGIVGALNHGLQLASAPFVARADADDVSKANRFAMQYEFLVSHPDVGVVSSSYDEIDDRGKYLRTRWMPVEDQGIRNFFPVFSGLVHPAACYRRNLVLSLGGYSAQAELNEDYELWLRLMPLTKFANISAPLICKRYHTESSTRKHMLKANAKRLEIARRYLTGGLPEMTVKKMGSQKALSLAKCHYYFGTLRESRRILFNLLSRNPYDIEVWRYFLPCLAGDNIMSFVRNRGIPSKLTGVFRRRGKVHKYIYP